MDLDGIYIYVFTIAIFIFISLVYICYKNTKDIKISVFWGIFIFYLSRLFFVARAQELSFLLFIWEFYFIEKLANDGKKHYGIILLIIGILLANIHSSVYPVYFVMYLPYIAAYIIKKLKIKIPKIEIVDISNFNLFLAIFIISLLTGFCSTAGTAPYTDMIRVMSGISSKYIGELSKSNWINNQFLFVLFFVSIISCILTKEKIKITDIFYIIGFGGLAVHTFRCSGFFLLVSGISINRIVTGYINTSVIFRKKYIKNTIFIVIIYIYILLIINSIIKLSCDDYIPKNQYPIEASNYILEKLDINNIKVYNHLNYGSYLEFRGIKPFIDSRTGMFTTEFNPGITILEDAMKVESNVAEYK